MAILTDSSKQNCAVRQRGTTSLVLLRHRRMASRVLSVWLWATVALSAPMMKSSAQEQELQQKVTVDSLLIVDQLADPGYGEKACGPTAIINSLRFSKGQEAAVFDTLVGSDDATRLRYLIDRWFAGRASAVVDGARRFGKHGCHVDDLAAGYNELLAEKMLPKMNATFLDRRDAGESDDQFVRRIHRSLADSLRSGVPPVVSLRSFLARKHYGEADETRWGIARHHYVVVTSVPDKLDENDLGFRFEYIDPNGGKTGSAFVYAEQHLTYRAFKGSNGVGEWLRGTPFLLVVAPGIESLQPLTADWPDRVIITLNYGIYR